MAVVYRLYNAIWFTYYAEFTQRTGWKKHSYKKSSGFFFLFFSLPNLIDIDQPLFRFPGWRSVCESHLTTAARCGLRETSLLLGLDRTAWTRVPALEFWTRPISLFSSILVQVGGDAFLHLFLQCAELAFSWIPDTQPGSSTFLQWGIVVVVERFERALGFVDPLLQTFYSWMTSHHWLVLLLCFVAPWLTGFPIAPLGGYISNGKSKLLERTDSPQHWCYRLSKQIQVIFADFIS